MSKTDYSDNFDEILEKYNIQIKEALSEQEPDETLENSKLYEKKLIGIIGTKNSGKDTVGDYLKNNFGFIKYAFAHPVKQICKSLFYLSDEQLEDRTLKEQNDPRWGISPREMFQRIGTDFGQFSIFKIFPELKKKITYRELWVKLFEQWYIKNAHESVVITDVRFKHEAKKIKEMGGQIIKINRNTGLNDSHISEIELNEISKEFIDFEIDNNYELVDLYSQIDKIIYLPF